MHVMFVIAVLVLASPARAQDDLRKPKVNIVSVVGCASQSDAATWTLTHASEALVTEQPYTSEKEIADARSRPLGTGHYRLLGTNEFVTVDELLKDQQRASFTTREGANTTGTLQPGRKVVVKGLLIEASQEKRLNLLSVQPLASTCP
jgi:hypothetical protein